MSTTTIPVRTIPPMIIKINISIFPKGFSNDSALVTSLAALRQFVSMGASFANVKNVDVAARWRKNVALHVFH